MVENSYLPRVEKENQNVNKNENTAVDRSSIEPSAISCSTDTHTDFDTMDQLNLNGKNGAGRGQKPQNYTNGKTYHSEKAGT